MRFAWIGVRLGILANSNSGEFRYQVIQQKTETYS
jgi:hypothetical protein